MIAAVQKERDRIALGADMCAKALRKGGRLVFVGAGTSGRLGIVESAEMPPTFGTNPLLVQGIMAGGKNAIIRAKEGAEKRHHQRAVFPGPFPLPPGNARRIDARGAGTGCRFAGL